jgi:hypothetical protein
MEDQTSKLKDNLPPIEYGYREEWTAFATRNAEFTGRFVNLEKAMGHDVFSQEQAEKIERDFMAVKSQFMVSDCKTCKTARLNHTWSKVDTVSMARMSDENLWSFMVPAYYVPTKGLAVKYRRCHLQNSPRKPWFSARGRR